MFIHQRIKKKTILVADKYETLNEKDDILMAELIDPEIQRFTQYVL